MDKPERDIERLKIVDALSNVIRNHEECLDEIRRLDWLTRKYKETTVKMRMEIGRTEQTFNAPVAVIRDGLHDALRHAKLEIERVMKDVIDLAEKIRTERID